MNRDVVQRIGATILRPADLEGMHAFFEKVWESEYDYVVVLARRCFALHNIFMCFAEGKARQTAENVLSHNALLLYADEFAEYYWKHRKFPTVLLVDDLLIHGRGMKRILHHFECAICEKLARIMDHELDYSERNLVRYHLNKAIQMRVYAISREPLIVEGLYRHQIDAQTERYGSGLKLLSQQISSFIQEVNEPNTSYRYSVMIADGFHHNAENLWKKVTWNYRGEQSDIYVSTKASPSFIPLVYTHGLNSLNSNHSVWITGLSVGGDMPIKDFDNICDLLIKEFSAFNDNKRFDFIIKILSYKGKCVQTQRIQFVSFLLSLINVFEFLSEAKYIQNETHKQYTADNLRHIATNFGLEKDVLPAISEIVANANIRSAIATTLIEGFTYYTKEMFAVAKKASYTDVEVINDAIDSEFQEIGMSAEKEACDICSSKIRFKPDERGKDTISLQECMKRIRKKLCSNTDSCVSDHEIVAALTAIVDSGLAALNFGYAMTEGSVQCFLKAGELSTFTIPRKWNCFIPALALVENERFDFAATPREMVEGFIKYLADYSQSSHEVINSTEKDLLSDFIERGLSFADDLYYCKQSFNYWNIRLLTVGDWRAVSAKDTTLSYYTFLCQHEVRRNHYLKLAKEYVDSRR